MATSSLILGLLTTVKNAAAKITDANFEGLATNESLGLLDEVSAQGLASNIDDTIC